MTFPNRKSPPPTQRLLPHAEGPLVMPDANPLTQELTAVILKAYGLLDQPHTGVIPISRGKPIRTAIRQRAAALRREVQQLRAQAVMLCLEAEELCKPRRH